MAALQISFRFGQLSDAEPIAALSTQVFLDTYASEGISPELAREAFAEYATQRFADRLGETDRVFVLAMQRNGLLGFAEVLPNSRPTPVPGCAGAELVRLYVQPRAHQHGLGRGLLAQAEQLALKAGVQSLWLAAWEGNANALGFYDRMGYADIGAAPYVIHGQSFTNRILHKCLAGSA
jgi:diamine N-acetyltransferase